MGLYKLDNVDKPEKIPTPLANYYTEAYADELIKLATKLAESNYHPLFIPTSNFSIRPKSLRVALYTARRYVRDNPEKYSEEVRARINDLTFEVRGGALPGLIIRRPSRTITAVGEARPIALTDGDHDKYQALMNWISDEHELNDEYIIDGPFGVNDYERYRAALEQLRGIYLAELTPARIKVIYHPGGR